MKKIIYILISIGLYSCSFKTDKPTEPKLAKNIQSTPPTVKEIDTLQLIPARTIQIEYAKSQSAYSHHSLIKKVFPFDGWLKEISDTDSNQTINSHIDSLLSNAAKKGKTELNLSDEWRLKYFVKRGWFQVGLDKTTVNKSYGSKTNKFRVRGADLVEIFRKNEGWSVRLLSENELLIQYGFFYPNGNQTSWDYQNLYLFTK